MMRRAASLALCVALAAPAHAQSADSGPMLQPRALTTFADVQTYDSLLPSQAGTPVQPLLTEVGMVLVVRMFRVVCLGLENGASLEDVTPEGFASYSLWPYLIGGQDLGTNGPRVLSATGDVEIDEAQGHPTISIRPSPEGMSCSVDWTSETPAEEDRHAHMARIIEQWLPYELALLRADRPEFHETPPTTGFFQWDRPCGDRWCPVTASYSLPSGRVSFEATLNITAIQGNRP